MKEQILAALTVHLLTLIYGINVGWVAPNMLLFQSENSPVGELTTAQISLIVSLMCLGGVVGTSLFGIMAEKWGRKWTLIWIAVPQILGGILLIYGTNANYIYAARLLFGLAGGGLFSVGPIFVAEISHEKIRGALGTVLSLNWNAGILLGYVLASWMAYTLVPLVAVGIGVIFIAIFIWLPESPDFLALNNRPEEAKRSYAFYKNLRSVDSAPEEGIRRAESNKAPITRQDFKDVSVRRGVTIACTLIFFADTCGVFTLTNYMTELLHWARIEADIYVATVGVGVIQILGCCICVICMDRVGRRVLFLTSAVGSAVSLYAFGFYFYLLDKPEYQELVHQLQAWLPVTALAGAILSSSLAIGAAPFFLIAELLPVRLRGFITTISLSVSWMVAFGVLHSFNLFVGWIGVAGTYWIYASVCAVEVVYVYLQLPETKNLSFGEIQRKLATGRI